MEDDYISNNLGVSDSDSRNPSKTKDLPTDTPPSQFLKPTDIGNMDTYRPNNALIKAKITRGFEIDLPTVKYEGHRCSTKNSYLFLPAFTVKKSSRLITIFYKKRKRWKVDCPEDVKRAKVWIENYLRDKLYWFSQKYPQIEFDQARAEVVIKDFGHYNKAFRKIFKKSMRIHNEEGKKVYPNHEWEHKTEEGASTAMLNLSLIKWSPELVKALNEVRNELSKSRLDVGGMLQQQTAISNAILLQTAILKKLTEKESLWQRIGRWFKC